MSIKLRYSVGGGGNHQLRSIYKPFSKYSLLRRHLCMYQLQNSDVLRK